MWEKKNVVEKLVGLFFFYRLLCVWCFFLIWDVFYLVIYFKFDVNNLMLINKNGCNVNMVNLNVNMIGDFYY